MHYKYLNNEPYTGVFPQRQVTNNKPNNTLINYILENFRPLAIN